MNTNQITAAKAQSPEAYRSALIEALEDAEIIPDNHVARSNAQTCPIEQLEAQLAAITDAE